MLVSGGAQIGTDALRHQGQDVGFRPAQSPGQQSRRQQAQQIQRHQLRVNILPVLIRDQDVVHQGHGEVRGHQSGRCGRQGQQKTGQQRAFVRMREAPQLEQGPSRRRCQILTTTAGAILIVLGHDGLAYRANRARQHGLQGASFFRAATLGLLPLKLCDPSRHGRLQAQSESPDRQLASGTAQDQATHTCVVRQFERQTSLQSQSGPVFFAFRPI